MEGGPGPWMWMALILSILTAGDGAKEIPEADAEGVAMLQTVSDHHASVTTVAGVEAICEWCGCRMYYDETKVIVQWRCEPRHIALSDAVEGLIFRRYGVRASLGPAPATKSEKEVQRALKRLTIGGSSSSGGGGKGKGKGKGRKNGNQ